MKEVRRFGWMIGLGLLGAVSGGCRSRPVPFSTTSTQTADGIVEFKVKITENPKPGACFVTVNGKRAADGPLTFPAASFPVGRQTVQVEVLCGWPECPPPRYVCGYERRGTGSYEFERTPIAPRLEISAAGDNRLCCAGASADHSMSGSYTAWPCNGTFCPSESEHLFTGERGTLDLALEAPPGTTVDIDGQIFTVRDASRAVASIDLSARVAGLDLGAEPERVTLPIVVTSPDGARAEGTLALSGDHVRELAAAALAQVTAGPIRFADDSDPPLRPRSAVLVDSQWWRATRVGAPARVREIDLVAVERRVGTKDGPLCGPYSSVGSIQRLLVETEVTLYERRTGKEVAKLRRVAEPRDCPGAIEYDARGPQPVVQYPDIAPAVNWVREQLRK